MVNQISYTLLGKFGGCWHCSELSRLRHVGRYGIPRRPPDCRRFSEVQAKSIKSRLVISIPLLQRDMSSPD